MQSVKALAGIGVGKVLLRVLREKTWAICLLMDACAYRHRNTCMNRRKVRRRKHEVMLRNAGHEVLSPPARRALAGCGKRIADNAPDECESCRRCDRRYTASILGNHADPPRACSAFAQASGPGCQLASQRFIGTPASFPPSGWVAGTGRILPVGNAHLWFFGSIFVEWSESLGRHVIDCAATKARSGPAPPKALICKDSCRACRLGRGDFWIDCLRRATTPR